MKNREITCSGAETTVTDEKLETEINNHNTAGKREAAILGALELRYMNNS